MISTTDLNAPLTRQASSRFEPWLAPVALSVITLLAFGLRTAWLDHHGIWIDEYYTLERTEGSINTMLATLPVDQMPLYFILIHAWAEIAGSSDFALRFPSVVWGTLSVPLLFQFARRLVGQRVGLLSAFLLTVNPFQVWYSQEARMYTQLGTLNIAALWALDVALGFQARNSRRVPGRIESKYVAGLAWTAYVVTTVLALYTHYYAWLATLIAGLWAISRLSARPYSIPRWRAFLLAIVTIGVLFLPWLPRAVEFLHYSPPSQGDVVSLDRLAGIYTFGRSVPDTLLPVLSKLALAMYIGTLLILAWDWRRSRNQRALVLASIALCLPAVMFIVLVSRNVYFHPRYLTSVTPIYSLILAQGIITLSRRRPPISIAVAVLLLGVSAYSLQLWYHDPQYAKSDIKASVAYILANGSPDDALLLNGPRFTLVRRYAGDKLERVVSRIGDRSQSEAERLLARIAEEHSRVWLAIQDPEPGGYAKAWLDTHAYQLDRRTIGDIRVLSYLFPPFLPAPSQPASIVGPLPVDLAWAAAPNPGRVGEPVNIALVWRPIVSVPPDLQVSLRLYNSDGEVLWQRDRQPGDGSLSAGEWRPGEAVVDRLAFRLADDLAPGNYTLRAVLYTYSGLIEQRSATLGQLTITR